jgi:membrane associated rhomboid family serine protease
MKTFSAPITLILLMWVAQIGNALFDFIDYAIYPRHIRGLDGIIFSPMIHADFGHLLSNSIPLFVLGSMLFIFYKHLAWFTLIWVWIVGGLLVWMFGRQGNHMGMSGVIYGIGFYVMFGGIFRKHIKLIIASFFVMLLYGGIFWGLFSTDPTISFEGHLFGAISGLMLAWWMRKVPLRNAIKDES